MRDSARAIIISLSLSGNIRQLNGRDNHSTSVMSVTANSTVHKDQFYLSSSMEEGRYLHYSLLPKLKPGTVGQQIISSYSSKSIGSFPLLMI